MGGPLAGVKVVEIGLAMAAPFCTMVLGDHGADVVKVERVGRGDDSRDWPPHFGDQMSHYFAAANRNKRSIAVDIKEADGAALVADLIEQADVVVENYRVGALERAGLGYEAMAARNPALVYCSISGFGQHGPRREDRANDLFMQAYAGSMSITGEVGGGPVRMGLSAADLGAGMFAAIGVLSALHHRSVTGEGQRVTTSLLEGQLAMLSYHLTGFFANGVVPQPAGSGAGIGVPYQGFPTADGWLIIATFNETMFAALCDALGHAEWATDPRFVTIETRNGHRDLILGMITDALADHTAAAWADILAARGIPSTPVNRIDQIVEDAQVVSQGMITSVDVDGIGPIRMAAPAVGFSVSPSAVVLPPPRVGEHSRELSAALGLDAEAIDDLVKRGVLGA